VGIKNQLKVLIIDTNKCSECSQKSKISCHTRNPRDKIKGKIYNIKKSAIKRGLNFELSDDETI
jgi:hypothetical protein